MNDYRIYIPKDVKPLTARNEKFISQIPKEAFHIPAPAVEEYWLLQLKWSGVYYFLNYGSSIIRWVGRTLKVPIVGEPLAWSFEKFVKWKYGYGQKSIFEVFGVKENETE